MSFEPIRDQETFDERIKSRLARERERWSKEAVSDAGGAAEADDLRAQLEAKDQEITSLKQQHYQEDVRRVVVGELGRRGVEDEGRVKRVLKLVDLDGVEAGEDGKPDSQVIRDQLDGVARDLPELLRARGAGSGGSSKPVFERDVPLTREQIEAMPPEEQNEPGMRARIDGFLSGERG